MRIGITINEPIEAQKAIMVKDFPGKGKNKMDGETNHNVTQKIGQYTNKKKRFRVKKKNINLTNSDIQRQNINMEMGQPSGKRGDTNNNPPEKLDNDKKDTVPNSILIKQVDILSKMIPTTRRTSTTILKRKPIVEMAWSPTKPRIITSLIQEMLITTISS